MIDFLDVLAQDAKATVQAGYYEHPSTRSAVSLSLRRSILENRNVPIITEVKGMSPSAGLIKRNFEAGGIASAMAKGGAVGISVLTEPKHFDGSLNNLESVRVAVGLPVLMKDIVVSTVQLDAAAKLGANAVLLIQSVYDRKYGELGVKEMIEEAHMRQLEVLLEVHDEDEFSRAIIGDADLVGINNRNIATLQVDLNTTKRVLENKGSSRKLIVSESGIHSPDNIRFLRGCGADAFLVGTAVMSERDVESKVRELAMTELTREERNL